MEILDKAGACFTVDDDLLNFNLEGENEEEDLTIFKGASASSTSLETPSAAVAAAVFGRGALSVPFPEFVEEEELEWLSNKDAFPSVETCFGILADNPELIMNHQSPVSVLENSSSSSHSNSNSNSNGGSVASCCNSLKVPTNYPVRARSKRRRRRAGYANLQSQQQSLWLNPVSVKTKKEVSFTLPTITSGGGGGMGRRCLHCQAEKTPQWRAGPMGPKTLCNACGVRYKSGRLLPEYRPANSPTFSSVLHSNSHRKVVEMRKQKLPEGDGIPVNVACAYRVA